MSLRTDAMAAATEALEQAMADLPDATGGLPDPQAGLLDQRAGAAVLFSTSHHAKNFPDILSLVRDRTRAKAVIGSTGAGIIGPRGEIEQAPALSILVLSDDRLTAAAAALPRIDTPDAADHLRSELPSLHRERGTLLVLADPRSIHPEFLPALDALIPETPVIGACAGWCASHSAAMLAADGETIGRGATALHLAGCIDPMIGVAQTIVPEVPPRRITEARGNVILRLDADPAADAVSDAIDAIRRQTKSESFDLFCTIAHLPADFEAGRYKVRNILGVDPGNKEVSVAEPVEEGQYISFGRRNPRAARRSFRQMLERMSSHLTARAPRAAILFNCAARGQALYGKPNVDFNAFREFFPELPLVGLFGFAEIGPTYWENRIVRSSVLNHTAILLLLSEPMEALGTA